MPSSQMLLFLPLEILLLIFDFYAEITALQAYAHILRYPHRLKGRFVYLENTGHGSAIPTLCRPIREHFRAWFGRRLDIHVNLPRSPPPSVGGYQRMLARIIPQELAQQVKTLHSDCPRRIREIQMRQIFPNLQQIHLRGSFGRHLKGPGINGQTMGKVDALLNRIATIPAAQNQVMLTPPHVFGQGPLRPIEIICTVRAGLFVLADDRGRNQWTWDTIRREVGGVVEIEGRASAAYEALREQKRQGRPISLAYSY